MLFRSPAVQMNSALQSTHRKLLSWNSIARHLGSSDRAPARGLLLRFAPQLLSVPLSSQRLLGPTLVTRLQIERVLLDVLDDVFLLNLALEATEGALDGFAFLNLDFGHALKHPLTRQVAPCDAYLKESNMLGYHGQARILGVNPAIVNEIVGYFARWLHRVPRPPKPPSLQAFSLTP